MHIEFLWNSSLLDNNKQESDNESINKIQTEENIRDGDNANRSHDYNHSQSHDYDHSYSYNNSNNNQNIIELPSLPFFNIFQYIKLLYDFTINLPKDYLLLSSSYSIFSFFFLINK